MRILNLVLCAVLFAPLLVVAQTEAEGKTGEHKSTEPPRSEQAEKFLAEARRHIEDENWRDSALSLGKIAELGGIPPSEFYFLLGKTFVRGQNFEEGEKLLQDYLRITGGKGEYRQQTEALIEQVQQYVKGRCQVCDGKGWTEARHKCQTCYGFGYVLKEDAKCYGVGTEPCRTCAGKGRIRQGRRTVPCPTCGGKGNVKCPWCQGTGHTRNTPCETCGRTGIVTSQIYCKHCDGDGRIDDMGKDDDKARNDSTKEVMQE